jgi:TPR repeat protein
LAQYQFGPRLEKSIGVETDLVGAAKYYGLSREQVKPFGEYEFGRCFEHGIRQNVVPAIDYYRLSAEHGNSFAQIMVGFALERGTVIAKDLTRTVQYYRLAESRGTTGLNTILLCVL